MSGSAVQPAPPRSRVAPQPAAGAPVLAFKRHLRAEIRAGKGAYLFSEQGVIAMRGARSSLPSRSRRFVSALAKKATSSMLRP